MNWLLSLMVFVAMVLVSPAASLFAAEEGCVTCHKDEREEFARSIHSQSGVTCRECHGGNVKVKSLDAWDISPTNSW